jgi:hypothetical protein
MLDDAVRPAAAACPHTHATIYLCAARNCWYQANSRSHQ